MDDHTSYAQMVAALVKPGRDIIDSLTPAKADLLHMVIGVTGEVAELLASTDMDNTIEEIGDIFFYMERIYQLTGVPRRNIETATHKFIIAGDLLDAVKKHVIYGKSLDESAVEVLLGKLNYKLDLTIASIGSTREAIIAGNMAKLTIRYGKKYSNEAAINRADKG